MLGGGYVDLCLHLRMTLRNESGCCVENVSRQVLEDLRKEDAQNESFETGVASKLQGILLGQGMARD